MIDLDCVEYCRLCKMPLAFIEVARDIGQTHKNSAVTRTMGRSLNVPALVVLYTASAEACLCDGASRVPGCRHGIAGMRWRRVSPNWTDFVSIDPSVFADALDRLHANHESAVHSLGAS
ncbi:MAG: hypothetical protein ABII76_12650 [Pseudomonadota bacterium]